MVILYFSCSLECYKLHQQRELCHPQVSIVSETDIANVPDQMDCGKILQMFTTDDTVTCENLQKLGIILKILYASYSKLTIIWRLIAEHSAQLNDLLCNPHLREFLKQIDCSTDAWKAMKIAMLEPLFLEFADVCLNIVEPPSTSDRMFDSASDAF